MSIKLMFSERFNLTKIKNWSMNEFLDTSWFVYLLSVNQPVYVHNYVNCKLLLDMILIRITKNKDKNPNL